MPLLLGGQVMMLSYPGVPSPLRSLGRTHHSRPLKRRTATRGTAKDARMRRLFRYHLGSGTCCICSVVSRGFGCLGANKRQA